MAKKILIFFKQNRQKAFIFLLGVTITILITKFFDKIFPNEPVIVKQLTDTINVIHNYNIPRELDNDSLTTTLKKEANNLKMLDQYEQLVDQKLTRIKTKNLSIAPNLILTRKIEGNNFKGYIQHNANAYLNKEPCPNLENEFIDISFTFFNNKIVNDIAYLRISISKYNSSYNQFDLTSIVDEYYEAKANTNFIRLTNTLSPGKYEIVYGFIFKDDLQKYYPTFYMNKCNVERK